MFTPVLQELSKRYHVYGVIMRMSENTADSEYNADGTINWSRQWGKDIFQFTEKMGIKKFHYVGKCHGTNPGWYLLKEHPELLLTFSSFYMAPHLCLRTENQWTEIAQKEGQAALLSKSIRHQDRIPLKIAEIKTLGKGAEGGPEAGGGSRAVSMYGESPELIWGSLDACEKDLSQTHIPVLLVFGTEDRRWIAPTAWRMKLSFLLMKLKKDIKKITDDTIKWGYYYGKRQITEPPGGLPSVFMMLRIAGGTLYLEFICRFSVIGD